MQADRKGRSALANSETQWYNAPFSHIYVEDCVWGSSEAQRVLAHFPSAGVIRIRHYKDVFNRKKQNFRTQHRSQALILAEKKGQLVYPGSPNCQDFGNAHFYYTSCMMNCVYNCEYCYLKGMYPTGNLVLFLNLDEIFDEVRKLCMHHPVYLCVSYDTDLMAVEPFAGYVRRWAGLTAETPNLTIEVRTKSGNLSLYPELSPCSRVIFAYTLSPDSIIRRFEHGTGKLERRLAAANAARAQGFPIRLCFDPILFCWDWRNEYRTLVEQTFAAVPPDSVRDISVGSFRLAPDYLKAMRRSEPCSAVVQYPYVRENGVYGYGAERAGEMEQFLVDELTCFVPKNKIFRWEEAE